uniref:AH domain-containing protein n=1 Tax=Trichobilharzia regenti TaxID=157069 RepID=A0AA85KE06_TRIRE|nr:unnamed protein product [Trichobilharzia regenti]
MKLIRSFKKRSCAIEATNVGDVVRKTRVKHRQMADISTQINNLLVRNKQSTDSISEVLRSLLQYLNSDAIYCSMIFPLTRDLENAHFELTDTLNKLLPESIFKQMAKYKHLEPQLKEWESSAQRVTRQKRNLDQSCNRSRNTVKIEKAHINYRASSMNHDYLTNYLLDTMNTLENEGTMACCDALFVLVSTYKQFSDRICSVLNCLFEEVNKLHECAARELNVSHTKTLLSIENATNATKWRASSIMTTDADGGGSSKYRSSSTSRMMSSDEYDPCGHSAVQISNPSSEFENSGELLRSLKSQKLSNGTISSTNSYHRSSIISKSTLPVPPPTRTATNSLQSTETLIQDNEDKTLCNASSPTVTVSEEIIDMHNDSSTNNNDNKRKLREVNLSNNITIPGISNNDTLGKSNATNNSESLHNNNSAKTHYEGNKKEQVTVTNNHLSSTTLPSSTNYSITQFNSYPQHYHRQTLYNSSNCQKTGDSRNPTVKSNNCIAGSSSSSSSNSSGGGGGNSTHADKAEMTLPIDTVLYFRDKNYATEKELSNKISLYKNEEVPFRVMKDHDVVSSYDEESSDSFIPIVIHKNCSTNTTPIDNSSDGNSNNNNNGYPKICPSRNITNNTTTVLTDVINSDRISNRETIFLNDNEIRSSRQNLIPWGCLPSPITEEEDE